MWRLDHGQNLILQKEKPEIKLEPLIRRVVCLLHCTSSYNILRIIEKVSCTFLQTSLRHPIYTEHILRKKISDWKPALLIPKGNNFQGQNWTKFLRYRTWTDRTRPLGWMIKCTNQAQKKAHTCFHKERRTGPKDPLKEIKYAFHWRKTWIGKKLGEIRNWSPSSQPCGPEKRL